MFHSEKQIILSSLLSVFLVGTLVITSTLMVNPNFSLDIRNYAKSQLEPEEEAFLKKHTKDNIKASTAANPPANNSNSEPKERKERIQRDDEIKDDPSAPTAVAPPVVTPPPAAIKTDEQIEEDFLRKNLQNKQTTSASITISPTSAPLPSTTTQTTPTTKTDEQIEQEFMEKRQSSIAQSSTQTTPTPTPIKTPTPAPTIKTDEQIEQEYMEKRQKTVAQSPVKTPAPTPNIAMEQFRCGERGGDWIKGQCQSPGSTPTPKPAAATPKPTSTPERLTKLYSDDRCGGLKSGESCVLVQGTGQYGIVQNSSATAISYNSGAAAGAPTPTPQPSFWDQFSTAVNNSELFSGEDGIPYGLGGGNAPVVMAPPSVLLSDNPQDFVDFYKGVAYSMGAGAAIGATVLAPAIVPAVLSNPIVQGALPYIAAADVADTTIAMTQCAASTNQNSPACQTAVLSLIAPPGAGFADDVADLVNSLAKPLNNLLDNTVFTGLTNDEYWGGGFSNSGGQTLIPNTTNTPNLPIANPVKPTSNLPDFNLNVSTTHLPGYNNNDVLIEQISQRKITIKTESQFIEIDLDNPELNNIINESTGELAGLHGEDYTNKLYDIRSRFGESQFSTSSEKSVYALAQELAVQTNTPIPLSNILKNREAICLELSCLVSLVNNTADNKIKDLAIDIFVPSNGFDIGHATNTSLLYDPITRLENFSPTFSQENIGAIQRIDFWSK